MKKGVYPERDYPHQELTERVIGAAVDVHRALGPGFLEGICERALVIELEHVGLVVSRQRVFPVSYRDIEVGTQRADLVVEGKVLIELKAVEELHKKHAAQVRSTLKAAGLEVGLLINFNEAVLKNGLRRIVLTKKP